MAKSSAKKIPKILDILLILLALYIVVTTCSSTTPKSTPTTDAAREMKEISDNVADLQPLTQTIPETPEDIPQIPVGLEGAEYFTGTCCDPTKGNCAPGQKICFTQEGFSQSPPATSEPPAAREPRAEASSCPTIVWTDTTLPTSNSEAGCWPLERPYGRGTVTGDCISDGKTEVANFYDAEQTNTVVNAIDNDVSRKMKIRPSQMSANYSYRADPEIPWGGYPTLSFIQGNSDIGLKV
tara:strand:- start:11019 stop:11735 length:717 start_codon:yes stop_codon:yes gene_type:complete